MRRLLHLYLIGLVSQISPMALQAQEGLYFVDNFEDGAYDDFQPAAWATSWWSANDPPFVEDQTLHLANCQPSGLCGIGVLDASGDWQNYEDVSVRVQARILDGNATLGVFGRWRPNTEIYYGVVRSDHVVALGKSSQGSPGNRVELEFSGDATQHDVVLKVDFIGDEISLAIWNAEDDAANELPVASFRDRQLRSGDVGVLNFPRANEATSIAIRWIEVAEIIPGDVDTNGVIDVTDIDALSAALREDADNRRYDVDRNGTVESLDHESLIKRVLSTWYGDATLDGHFNSRDLVQVFSIGEYEDEIAGNSGWADGDWDGSGDFDSSDLVVAFRDGGYELAPPAPLARPVPEPNSALLLVIGMILCHISKHLAQQRQSI